MCDIIMSHRIKGNRMTDFEKMALGNNSKNNDTVLRRLMLILQKLSENELPSRRDLEEEFNVGAKTIQRDLYQRLSYFPIERNKEGQYHFIEGFTLSKSSLKNDEMLFVYLALSQIKDINKNFEKTTHNIFSKLLTPKYSSPYHIKGESFENIDMDSSLLNDIESAIEYKNTVSLGLKNRVFIIEPYKVVSFDGIWYLLGKDLEDKKIKTVFIHEIIKMTVKKEKFVLDKPVEDILENVHTAWFKDGNSMEVLIKVSSKAAYHFKLKNILQSQKILKEENDGSLLIQFSVSTEEDIDNTIKAWIPDIELISPKFYREKFIKELQDYINKYE